MASKKDINKAKAKANANASGNGNGNGNAKGYKQDPDPGQVNDPGSVYQPEGPPTFEKVWLMFEASDKKWQETERFLKEKSLETERFLKEKSLEADKRFQESERLMKEQSRESDKRFRETEKSIKKAFDLFSTQWGRLVESLVEGDLPRVLQERGIMIKRTVERAKSDEDKGYEFDIIAVDGDVCVVVEVKTTLRPDDVTEFLRKLKHFREWMPEYANKNRVLGAVAYIRVDSNSDKMAGKSGLFTIRATGKSAKIVNPEGFKPKAF